jgi:fructokinase
VIFDVNLRPTLWPDLDAARDNILHAIESVTVVKLNETELEFLTGVRDPDAGSQRLLDRGVQLCCVSLGARGACFANSVGFGFVPTFDVEVADTTGSGDAFLAGLAYGLSNLSGPVGKLDRSVLVSVLRFANACGALAATEMGAMTALPTRAAVEGLLQSGQP